LIYSSQIKKGLVSPVAHPSTFTGSVAGCRFCAYAV
jgi:hypothetical protein